MNDCTHISKEGLQIHIITEHKELPDRIYCLMCNHDFTRVEYEEYMKDLKARKQTDNIVRTNV